MRETVHLIYIVATTLLLQSVARPAQGAQFAHPTLGYTLTYPDSWVCDTEGVEKSGADGPVFMTFPVEKLVNGGVLPPGGARIFVQVSPPGRNFPEGEDQYIRLRQMAQGRGAVDISEAHEPDGVIRLTFTETWEAGTFKEDWIARHRNGRLFVFMLSYYADDPKGPSYERALDSIVASIAAAAAIPGHTSPTPKR